MNVVDRDLLWDSLSGLVVVLTFMAFSSIGKIYHGFYTFSLACLFLLFIWGVFLFVMALSRLMAFSRVYVMGRIWIWLSLMVGLVFGFGEVAVEKFGLLSANIFAFLILAAGCSLQFVISIGLHRRFRRIIAGMPILLIIGFSFSRADSVKPIEWFGPALNKKQATVILLYDELNANASFGLQKILRDREFNVNFKSIRPVHNSTAEVVPEIFSGNEFEGARACGFTKICSSNYKLDFSKIFVLRDDVDVVGFFHPYCAIRGLRYCERLNINQSFWNSSRWMCALSRRFDFKTYYDNEFCGMQADSLWLNMANKLLDAMFHAPALRNGGILYVHLPFPHPPAKISGTLAEQYHSNIQRAEDVLRRLLDEFSTNNIEVNFLIFSDHPLRQKMWCENINLLYRSVQCEVDQSLVDFYVPLIIASKSKLPVIDHVNSNIEVFDVLRNWLSYH